MSTKPDFFDIDVNALDREWVNQPALYHKYALRLADARRKLEQVKTASEISNAELDADIRARPEKYGIEKVTEAAIKSGIMCAPAYIAASKEVIDAKHAVDVLAAAVATVDHRKRALENLVDLRLADYFSEPRHKRGNGEKINEANARRARRPIEREAADE
jgi:hypothetical protein